MNKKGAMDEGLMMIYRLALITIIAFVILGISSVSYDHYVDIRDAEARILAREIMDCISPDGVINVSSFSEDDMENILVYCGYDVDEIERFYVEVIFNSENSDVKFSQGDSRDLWVLEIFKTRDIEENLKKYQPGYYDSYYLVYILENGNKIRDAVRVKVLVNHEF